MQELCSSSGKSNGRWTHEQHLLFLEGLRLFGKNWKKIEQLLQTRTGAQIRSHAQKFFLKLRPTPNAEPSSTSEPQEEPEEPTLNSKSSADSLSDNEDSYFLSKIIQFSNGSQCFDFWQGLVDCKHQRIAKCSQFKSGSSFIIYEGRSLPPCRNGNVLA